MIAILFSILLLMIAIFGSALLWTSWANSPREDSADSSWVVGSNSAHENLDWKLLFRK
jgi:hypothetical protein